MKDIFEEVYDSYHHDLYQFIFYMVKDKQLTEDLVQEVYIKIINSHDTFKGDSSLKTWIFSIARHVTIDYFRSQKRKRQRIMQFFDWGEKGEEIPAKDPLPEDMIMYNEEMKQVYTLLDKCTIDQQAILILRFIHSYSIRETAEALGFSISKIKTTQHRALKKLHTFMKQNDRKGGNRS